MDLFVCNQGKHRSRTAALLFGGESAGLFSEKPVTRAQLQKANRIFVMEDFQREEIGKRFPKEYLQKQILSLNIPDTFHYNQPELITLLKEQMSNLEIAA